MTQETNIIPINQSDGESNPFKEWEEDPSRIESKHYPFWDEPLSKSILVYRLIGFLGDCGFRKYRDTKHRTDKTTIIRIVDGYIEVHNANTVKDFLVNYLKKETEDEIKCLSIGLQDTSQVERLFENLMKINPTTLDNYLQNLQTASSLIIEQCEQINILRDKAKESYIPFKNGVVKITPDEITVVPKDNLKLSGAIWESNVIDHNIEISNEGINYFGNFIKYALKKGVVPSLSDNDIEEGTNTLEHQQAMNAFETGFGYLLHSYNPPDDAKLVLFIDKDASSSSVDGGNGKSVSMDAVKHFRETAFIDGKTFRGAKSDSNRFNFSSVTPATGFCYINDLNPDFDITNLFSQITDDMTVEGKGTNKIIIPRALKPKLGITTNYIVGGVGTSYARRQHIVEFGDFWSRCTSLKIKPKRIIGKMLFEDDFSEDDWNTFYNYGFKCIQRYLNEGLVNQDNTSYQTKVLIKEVEGVDGNGTLTNWLLNWIENDQPEEGISVEELFDNFTREHATEAMTIWVNKEKVHKALYTLAMGHPQYDYNAHLAHKGKSQTDRRWRQGSREEGQKVWVKITKMDQVH